jgi:hypothetical protein
MTGIDWNARRIELQDASTADPARYLTLLEQWGCHDPQMAAYWCAVGVSVDEPNGQSEVVRHWLTRSLELGWFQGSLIPGYAAALAAQPDAVALGARLKANLPPVPLELLDWPDAPPGFALPQSPLSPEREDRLRAELPPAQPGALATALDLLTWASTRWAHAGSSEGGTSDALALLERAQAGERFRCVEYGVLLSAALRARQIPALVLGITVDPYHAGLGCGHVVSAAWIDELGRWVVLDGQNGAIWHDGDPAVSDDRVPLGVQELVRRFRAGESRPHFTTPDGAPVEQPEFWWPYFAHADPPHGKAAGASFTAVMQGIPHQTTRLTRHADALWPNLGDLSTAIVALDGRPALKFTSLHPYAQGVLVEGEPVPDTGLALPAAPGEYAWTVQTLGPYGPLPARSLRFLVRQ